MPRVPVGFIWATFKRAECAGDGNTIWCLGWQLTWCGENVDDRFEEARHISEDWVRDGTIKLCDGCMAEFIAKHLAPGHTYRQDIDREIPTTVEEIMES